MPDTTNSNASGDTTDNVRYRRFWWCAVGTIATIYALILVGGIVRATGAGMGCPDWPTCFGQWIPPLSESELPSNYQEIYADRGYADTLFNVRKTWTEYLNRLLGVFTGFTILLTLIFAYPLRKRESSVFWLSLAGFILVGVQGWLGSRVVASNLLPGMITIHMLLAQVIVGIVIAACIHSARHRFRFTDIADLSKWVYPMLIVAMGAGLLQLVVGTQVREAVDMVARNSDYQNRHLWIDNLPLIFSFHKYYAIPVMLLNAWLIVSILGATQWRLLRGLCIALAALLVGTVVIGMSMDRLNLPMFAQPLHLWWASLIFGIQLALLLLLQHCRNQQSSPIGSLQLSTGQ